LFDLVVVFVFDNVLDNKFDQSKLLTLLDFEYAFLLKGPGYKNKVYRYGIYKTIKKVNPDIIFGYEYSIITQYLILLKKLRLIHQKIGSTIDDNINICHHVQSIVRYLARKISIHQLDNIVVMSEEVAQYYKDKFNLKDNQVIISPIFQKPERLRENAIELESLAREYLQKYSLKGKKVLLFVGRFIPEKGITQFLKTILPLFSEQEDLALVFIGEGIEQLNIEALIHLEQLEQKVFLPGRYEGLELNSWYLCSSGFILPSTFEPFGAVVNEALIFGLNVLCSQYAGSSYLINEDNGILFDPMSVNDTLEKTSEFINILDTVNEIKLYDKPSLMPVRLDNFNSEWMKLLQNR
jgi:glycosyltransferase involved in cell wall biosynthesis